MSDLMIHIRQDELARMLACDRRAAMRFPVDGLIAGVPLSKYEFRWAKVRDISLSGIGLLARRTFERDDAIVLKIQNANGPAGFVIPTRVVRLGREGKEWAVGCAFDAPLTEDMLKALIDQNALLTIQASSLSEQPASGIVVAEPTSPQSTSLSGS